jgi:hypothetical protein
MPDVARWGTASGPARLSTTIGNRLTGRTSDWGIIKHRKDHTRGLGDNVTIAARSLDKAEKTRNRVAKYKVKVVIGCHVVTISSRGQYRQHIGRVSTDQESQTTVEKSQTTVTDVLHRRK